jgi:dienelactone hydrolase
MQFLFWGIVKVYAMYFEQLNAYMGAPFVVGLHGGEGTPELVASVHMNSANYNHLVRRITDRGANVFAPQLLLWDKDIYGTEYDRFRIDGKLRQLGGSITALELYMLRGSIDYFINHEAICHSKIGIAGLSYGGMYALHLAAIDTRIRACYSCSCGHDIFDFSSPDRSYLNAQSCFSSAEVAALIAPRALTMAMGDRDELFPVKQTQETFAQILPYYKIFNCEDLFLPIVFHGIHELDKQDIELKFLMDHL